MYFQVPVTAKKHYRLYDMDALTKAYMSVKDDSMPIKKAARLNGVPETTVRKRISGAVDVDCVKSGPNPMLTLERLRSSAGGSCDNVS